MQVTFKHIGMIEGADIRLDGLTVIAGENDTGKSTVGKILFSLIKTFNRYERDARTFQVRKLYRLIDDYYFDFRRKTVNQLALDMGKGFFEEIKSDILAMVGSDKQKEEIRHSIADKVDNFTEKIFQTVGMRVTLAELSGDAVELIENKPPVEEIFRDSFSRYMMSVISGEVANKFAADKEYSISGKEGNNILFMITGRNGLPGIRLNDQLYFEDATFIESPVILNMADTIRFSKSEFDATGELKNRVELLGQGYVPEYIRDLILKLTDQPGRGPVSPIKDQMQEIIGGDFYYDTDERDFIFEKGDRTFKGVSIASGIKSLGMIHILNLAGFIGPKSLLIIDEPEAHLHPEWQIRFAEAMVNLVSQGNYILLTSHSPYLIEALKLFSGQAGLNEKTAFYLAEKVKDEFSSRILEVTDDISPIMEILAKPFEDLEHRQLGQKEMP